MGAEATLLHPPRQPRTPSRLSNCGEMVSKSVLEQLEMELRLESDAVFSESRIPSPGGRKLLVGMKLNATCREMLAWTILDLAKPGDHIIAFHVSAFPVYSGSIRKQKSLEEGAGLRTGSNAEMGWGMHSDLEASQLILALEL